MHRWVGVLPQAWLRYFHMDGHQEPLSFSGSNSALAGRLRLVRMEIYGEQGGPELAAQLGLPLGTWDKYENGARIPGEVLLRFLEVTDTEAHWLLYGDGPIPISNLKGIYNPLPRCDGMDNFGV